jgi:hypothetical protein
MRNNLLSEEELDKISLLLEKNNKSLMNDFRVWATDVLVFQKEFSDLRQKIYGIFYAFGFVGILFGIMEFFIK